MYVYAGAACMMKACPLLRVGRSTYGLPHMCVYVAHCGQGQSVWQGEVTVVGSRSPSGGACRAEAMYLEHNIMFKMCTGSNVEMQSAMWCSVLLWHKSSGENAVYGKQ